MGIALREVQTNFTARSPRAGGGERSCSLLAFGIKSSPRRCRNSAKHRICIITMWTLHPTLLLTEEGPDAQRGRALAQGHTVSQTKGGSSDDQTWCCLPTVPTAFQMRTQQERGRGGLRLATQWI